MRSFFSCNLQVLEAQDAPVYHWLASVLGRGPSPEPKMMINRWGLPDWQLSPGIGLFHAMHPNECYRDWIPTQKPEKSATIIIGTSLGYGLNQVLRNTPASHRVFVLEPRPEMMTVCLTQTDYTPFLENSRLVLLPPDLALFRETVFQHLPLQYEFGKILFRSDPPSRQLGAEYSDWSRRCNAVMEDFCIEMNTFRVCHETMIRNELANYPRAVQDGSLMQLKDRADGVTAVILGAGPSLERFSPLIKNPPGRAFHVAALQSLPTLQSAGVKPHACMAVDYTEAMVRVLDRLDDEWISDIPLIYSCKVCPELLEKYSGPTLPLWTVGGLGPYLWQDRELVLNTGRNVGVALLRFLQWCGVRRILFIGQDFAWSGERSHSTGHWGADRMFRFDPKQHVKLKNKFGETIYSAPVYLSALHAIENELASSGVAAFNLYGGNAVIRGAVDVDAEDIRKKNLLDSEPGSLERFIGLLKTGPSTASAPQIAVQNGRWTASLRDYQKRLEKLFKKQGNRQQEIRAAFGQLLHFINGHTIYQPYLLPEIRSLAGMMFGKTKYGLIDMAHGRQILKQVVRKVREMDRILIDSGNILKTRNPKPETRNLSMPATARAGG